METTILVAGDICPIGRNQDLFASGDRAGLLGDLSPIFYAASLVVANLECPLIEKQSPIRKSGRNIGCPVQCVGGLKAMGVDIAGLANNHIMDHGKAGLRTTLRVLRDAGITAVGAGNNAEDAAKIVTTQNGSLTIGVLAVAEREFSIASKDTSGANPCDPIDFVKTVRKHKNTFEYLLVLLHGGIEYYPFPSPRLQKLCRFMIEEGANAVICQHSHCPGCYEQYQHGHIVYGQGNFLFDLDARKKQHWNQGFLVGLRVQKERTADAFFIPYLQSFLQAGARRMAPKEEESFLNDLETRSRLILDDGFVCDTWRAFCASKRDTYLSTLRGHRRLVRALNKLTHFTNWQYSRDALTTLENVVRCESHLEVLNTILSDFA